MINYNRIENTKRERERRLTAHKERADMNKTNTKRAEQRQNKVEVVKEYILFDVKQDTLLASTNFNAKQVSLKKLDIVKSFLSFTSKEEAKKYYNVILAKLDANSRAKKLELCKNTHYDSYYVFVKFMLDNCITEQQRKANGKKLLSFLKRDKI